MAAQNIIQKPHSVVAGLWSLGAAPSFLFDTIVHDSRSLFFHLLFLSQQKASDVLTLYREVSP